MVSAVNFAVRDVVGGRQLGTIAGEGQGNFIPVASGDHISLNISPANVVAYAQQGRDLVITLADGRVIVLAGYFDAADAQVYLSADGTIAAVDFSGDGTGALTASFGPVQGLEKWSPLDDLTFDTSDLIAHAANDSEEPATMGVFAPAALGGMGGAGALGAGVLGAGLLGGGGSGGGGGNDTTGGGGGNDTTGGGGGNDTTGGGGGNDTTGGGGGNDTTGGGGGNDTTGSGGGNDTTGGGGGNDTTGGGGGNDTTGGGGGNDTTGGGGGNDTTGGGGGNDTTGGGGGNDTTGGGGGNDTTGGGGGNDTTGGGGGNDTTGGGGGGGDTVSVSVTEGTQNVGHIENLIDYSNGVTIGGEGDIGATVTVTIDGHSRETTVGADGSWSVTFPTNEIDGGERQTTVTVTATNSGGSSTTVTETLVLDTIPNPIEVAPVTDDNTVALAEYDAGFSIVGTTAGGATVTLAIGGSTVTTTANAEGAWSVTIPAGTIPVGTYETTVTATTVDAAGNSSSSTRSFNVDTEVSVSFAPDAVEGDNIVNLAEASDGVTLTGTSDAGSAVSVTWGSTTLGATTQADGSWSVTFPAGSIPAEGTTTATVTATDAAGNSTSATRTIEVDTQVSVGFNSSAVEGDNIVNLAEASDGVTLTGTSDAGSAVSVTWGSTTLGATTQADGSWSVTFPAGSIPADGTTTATVTATDAAGNSTSATRTIEVDTVPNPISITPVTTDNTVSQAEFDAGFTINGTTDPGAAVTLSIASTTQTVTAGADGAWSVTFASGSLAGGTYEASVTATTVDAAGNPSSSTRTFDVDTEVTVAFAPDPVAGDNIVNMVEATAGVTLTGTSQAGSTVSVEWGGTSLAASSDASGNWTVTFPGASVPADGNTTVTVTATDAVGNTTSATRNITVDTQTSASLNAVTGNDEISGIERTAGVTMTGTAEAGSAISVTFDGVTRTTTAGANGTWSVTYGSADIRSGFYEAPVQITATDLAGNVATDARMVSVDTETLVTIDAGQVGGDDVISGAERAAGVTLTGTAEPGASVEVTFAGTTRLVTAASNGTWSASYTSAEVPQGTQSQTVAVRATDALGNTASATHTVNIDTEVVPLTRNSLGAGPDSVVNDAEAQGGITITGTVEAGSTVSVQFASGQPLPATVASNGSWSVNIPEGDIPAGEALARLTVTATDRYGNSRTHTEDVTVDRIVRDFGPAEAKLSGDGYLNAVEAGQGLTVNGTAEPGATVVVKIAGGGTMTATADVNGDWSTTFTGANLPRGELTTTVTVTATDRAGNVASYSQPLVIDTIAPGAPDVVQFTRNALGLTRIETDEITETYDFTRVDQNGNVSDIAAVRTVDEVFGTQNVSFGSFAGNSFVSTPVPDGSYLVVNTTDVAGNESSTLLVVNNTNAPNVDLSRPGLSGFDLSAVDLTFAPDAELTITEAQILSLTGPDHSLVVKGGADDHVSVVDGVATGGTQQIDGETYNIYTVGSSGATVLLDDDITVV